VRSVKAIWNARSAAAAPFCRAEPAWGRTAAAAQADDEEAEADEVAEALRLQKAAAAALAPEDFGLGAGAADCDAASSGDEDAEERGDAATLGRRAREARRRPPPRARAACPVLVGGCSSQGTKARSCLADINQHRKAACAAGPCGG